MKTLFAFLLLFPLVSFADIVPPPRASQADVAAFRNTPKYVSPDKLQFQTNVTLVDPTIVGTIPYTNLPSGVVTNGQDGVGLSYYPTFSYGTTNPVDVVLGLNEQPLFAGHYAFSTIYGGYTNSARTNYLLFKNVNIGLWMLTTNTDDADGSQSPYWYTGSQDFPTNDISSWLYNQATPSVVYMGTFLSATNPIYTFFAGAKNTVVNSYVTTVFETISNINGNIIFEHSYESTQPYFDNDYTMSSMTPGLLYSNLYDAAHNFAGGGMDHRDNAGVKAIGGDSRTALTVWFVYGTHRTNSNGTIDNSHIADKGGTQEQLTRRPTTFSTSVQSGTFLHPFKLGTGVTVGNIPDSVHGLYQSTDLNQWFHIMTGGGLPAAVVDSDSLAGSPIANAIENNYTNLWYSDNNATRWKLAKFKQAPQIPNAVTVGASPFLFANVTGVPLQIDLDGGAAAYTVARNGVTIHGATLAGYSSFILSPTNSITITYSGAAPAVMTNAFSF